MGEILGGRVSHLMQPGSCQLQCPFTFGAGELFFPATHLLRSAHTRARRHGHKVIRMLIGGDSYNPSGGHDQKVRATEGAAGEEGKLQEKLPSGHISGN